MDWVHIQLINRTSWTQRNMICIFVFFREYASTIPRPFTVRYNPYTQSVDVIESKEQVLELSRNIKCKIRIISSNALTGIPGIYTTNIERYSYFKSLLFILIWAISWEIDTFRPPYIHSSNAHAHPSSELDVWFLVAWAFAGRLCVKYHNLMSWLSFLNL